MVIDAFKMLIIKPGDEALLKSFLLTAGSSLKSFRYFEKRSFTVLQNHIITCVLKNNEQIIGYGHLDEDEDKVWLGVAVVETFKGMGYGTLLIDFLISTARQKNIRRLNLTVDASNERAIRLYKKFGFSFMKQINDKSMLMEYILDY